MGSGRDDGRHDEPSTFAKSLTYNFPAAGANNGQLQSLSDGNGGETVVYQYDALKRLISAAATPNSGSSPAAWTQTYGHDGFGNLTSKSLNGGAGAIAVDPATNQLQVPSIRYDANGNLYAGTGGLAMTYDESNRLASARPGGGSLPVEYYGYAPDNKRVLRVKSNGAEEWTMYGARGEKLGVYTLSPLTATYDQWGRSTGQKAWFTAVGLNIWFDGRLVAEGVTAALPIGNPVYQDRLGTNRASGARLYPYGEEMGGANATANDRVKFGTYTRDGFSGLDYADQRYYSAGDGRFNTADPYQASGGPSDPASWNRYSYTGGDPINRSDPKGLMFCAAEFESCDGDVTSFVSGISNSPGCPGFLAGMGFVSIPGPGCYAPAGIAAALFAAQQAPPPDPCSGIGQKILDTITGKGMPGGKSLILRVTQQITGSAAQFDGHQEQIDNYRNRLRNLKGDWIDNDCDDPNDPPYGTNEWIKQTDWKVLQKYNQNFHQYVESMRVGAYAAAAALMYELTVYLTTLGELAPVLVF